MGVSNIFLFNFISSFLIYFDNKNIPSASIVKGTFLIDYNSIKYDSSDLSNPQPMVIDEIFIF